MIDFENGVFIFDDFRVDRNTRAQDVEKHFRGRFERRPATATKYPDVCFGWRYRFLKHVPFGKKFWVEGMECTIDGITLVLRTHLDDIDCTSAVNYSANGLTRRTPLLFHEYNYQWLFKGCCVGQRNDNGESCVVIYIPALEMSYLNPPYLYLSPEKQHFIVNSVLNMNQMPH